jgi:phosphoribosylamine--glycine ligase
MGAYSPAPVITDKLMDQITREILVPIVDGMNRNGTPYRGILYAGLMMTSGGPRVLEFNVRFGDPETQPILMRLKSDLLEVFLAVCDGRLNEITLTWDPRPAVCVVMASGGYPGDYEKGKVITGIDQAESLQEVKVFHAGTTVQNDHIVTNGGRVLGVTAMGNSVAAAKERAYEAVDKIQFDQAVYRHDIGDKAIKAHKVH